MLLKVDNREKTLIPALTVACSKIEGVQIEVENMPLGDAGIYDNDGKELILFERKTLTDLAASIKDGRYSEQSMRLSAIQIPNHHVVYILEGSFESYNYSRNKIHPNTLRSAIVSLNYYKGFTTVRSWNTLETVETIMSYVEKLQKTKDKTPYYGYNVNSKSASATASAYASASASESASESTLSNAITNEHSEYISTIKRTKKDNVTIQNIVTIMLCQIPNVSTLSAEAISSQYPTLELLVEACKNGKESFDNLRLKKSNRKISSQCISSVITYVLAKPVPTLDVTEC